MSNEAALPIRHNVERSRFEALVEGHLSVAHYVRRDNVLVLTHTVVPPALRRRGIAAALIAHVLAYAREQHLRVEPQCAYAASYMQRHPETQDLLVRDAS